MRIKNIRIRNFRNYPKLDLPINDDLVILTGPNAVGKTNLLESIYFASLFKSFRDDTGFIFLKDANHLELGLTVEKEGQNHELEIFLEKREKIFASFRLDGVKKKRREAQGFFTAVIFDPSDVEMFNKGPEARRKYLNMVLCQKNPKYLEILTEYKKAKQHKLKLLQNLKLGLGKGDDLPIWNRHLAEQGSKIIFMRRQFINFLNRNFAEVYTTISGFHRPAEVWYSGLEGQTEEEIRHNFERKLEELISRELLLTSSLVGPHCDDFSLRSEGLFLIPFSSRGELRSQVLTLKILELEYLSYGDEKPVLLLDDVLSELDEVRRKYLLKFLQGRFQTFITTTQALDLPAQHITLSPAEGAEKIEKAGEIEKN